MNISFLITEMGGGGRERVISLLSSELANLGHNVSIICTTYHPKKSYKVSEKVHLHFLCDEKKMNDLAKIHTIRTIIKQTNCDALIGCFSFSAIQGIFAAAGLKTKVLYYEPDSPFVSPDSKLLRFCRKAAFKWADGLVFQSLEAKRAFIPLAKKKAISEVINNPINFKIVPKAAYTYKRLIAAGRLADQKNYPCLLKAFDIFHKHHPDYSLSIFGSGPMKDVLVEMINDMGMQYSVALLPYSTSVWNEMANSSIFVMSSKHEGMPNSLLEAGAMGLPAVVTDFTPSVTHALIEPGVNGEIVPLNNHIGFAHALIKIADNFESYKQGALANSEKMRRSFDITPIANKWLSFLQRLVQPK